QGAYFYANGDRYVGPWINGKRDGLGVYFNADGNSEGMEFSNGQRIDN
ncbi:MAG: hypothetical protein IIC60_11190, partial [Proteobacteria bacterium]|nr:hypothetical protein [Pseudomonadota bacterium]